MGALAHVSLAAWLVNTAPPEYRRQLEEFKALLDIAVKLKGRRVVIVICRYPYLDRFVSCA